MTARALPELELIQLSAFEPAGGSVDVRVERDARGWWPIAAAVAVSAGLVLAGRSTVPRDEPPPALATPPTRAAVLPATPGPSFSIVMADSISHHIVLVDPNGRAVRLAITAEEPLHPLDVVAPRPLDPALGGLPVGRRPVAVLDKSIVLVPASTAGPPVELWAGGANLHVVDGVGRFVAASEDRVATVDEACTSCAMRISTSDGDLVQEIEPFTGFQPVSVGMFSPNGRYVAVRFAEEHRPFDGVAIADLRTGRMAALEGVGGDDALAMAWSAESDLYLLGPRDVVRYEPEVGPTGRFPIESWNGGA